MFGRVLVTAAAAFVIALELCAQQTDSGMKDTCVECRT